MNKFVNFIKRINKLKVMVVGDIIADVFISGQPERLSREAPVLILKYDGKTIMPGGGANAASNINSLEAGVKLVGLIGKDSTGLDLKRKLNSAGINTEGIMAEQGRATAVKTRILAGGEHTVKQQIVRIDYCDKKPVKKNLKKKLLDLLKKI